MEMIFKAIHYFYLREIPNTCTYKHRNFNIFLHIFIQSFSYKGG